MELCKKEESAPLPVISHKGNKINFSPLTFSYGHQDSDLCEHKYATHPLIPCVLIMTNLVGNLMMTSG